MSQEQGFLVFLIQLPAMFLCAGFVIRFLGQLGRADFYNPLGQTVLSITNWAIIPLRKIIPSFGKMDLSCIIAVYLTQLFFGLLTLTIIGAVGAALTPNFIIAGIIAIASAFINILMFSMFLVGITSILLAGQHNPFVAFLSQAIEPFTGPFRKLNLQVGMLDLSFYLAFIALVAFKMLILSRAFSFVGIPDYIFF